GSCGDVHPPAQRWTAKRFWACSVLECPYCVRRTDVRCIFLSLCRCLYLILGLVRRSNSTSLLFTLSGCALHGSGSSVVGNCQRDAGPNQCQYGGSKKGCVVGAQVWRNCPGCA